MGDFKLEKNVEFINYIYKNAEMGVIGIDHVFEYVKDNDLRDLLVIQRKEYQSIVDECKCLLKGKEQGVPTMAKISSNFMIDMAMIKDGSAKIIAKMMIEGTNKGVIEITEKLNNYKEKDNKGKLLAKKLLKTEQNNIEKLKKYL